MYSALEEAGSLRDDQTYSRPIETKQTTSEKREYAWCTHSHVTPTLGPLNTGMRRDRAAEMFCSKRGIVHALPPSTALALVIIVRQGCSGRNNYCCFL